MDDRLYEQRRNLFIKREKFESRLIKYLERLIIYMDQTGNKLPKDIAYQFPMIEKKGINFGLYSEYTGCLFTNMKNADIDVIERLDAVLDCLHRQLDEYEDVFGKLTFANH